MRIKEIHTFLKEDLSRVEAQMDAALRSDVALVESTNLSLREHPGKMLRSMLSLLMAGALGKVNESSVRYAAATELLHNATLLHDDVVDEASERRGQASVNAVYGNKVAVLLGDYLVDAHPGRSHADGFMGTLLHFSSDDFKDWDAVMTYFTRLGGQ